MPDHRTGRAMALHRRWMPLVLLVLAATLCGPLPVRAAAPYAGQEQRFLQLMNAARAGRGLPALAASPEVAGVARRWSRRMAADGRLRHNPRVGVQIPVRWRRWGENVGYASNGGGDPLRRVTRRLHRAFMHSPGHRANILGRFNQVGVGVAVDGDGTMWATMVFVQGRRRGALTSMVGLEPSAVSHLTDVAAPSHPDALSAAGITPTHVYPSGRVTRARSRPASRSAPWTCGRRRPSPT